MNCRLLQIIDGALRVNPYPTNIYFVLKMWSSTNIQMHFRLDFIMEANTMNPDQTAPWEQSDPGSYCLQEFMKQMREQVTKVVLSLARKV